MRRAGSTGKCCGGAAATIQDLNMPNRVVLGAEVKAGDKFQIAVFAINGPISDPFGSIWFRQAMLEFYR